MAKKNGVKISFQVSIVVTFMNKHITTEKQIKREGEFEC